VNNGEWVMGMVMVVDVIALVVRAWLVVTCVL